MEDPSAPTVHVRLPRHLAYGWNVPTRLEVEAGSIETLWTALDAKVPGLAGRLADDQGVLRRHLMVFVNEEEVPRSDLEDLRLSGGDRVLIVASVSGG